MKVYLAGPMRGYPEYNFPRFREAAAQLREMGYDVLSPAELDEELDGFDGTTEWQGTIKEAMKRDLPSVLSCDAVVLLEGWQNSQGAKLEAHVAKVVGMPIGDIDNVLRGTTFITEGSPLV